MGEDTHPMPLESKKKFRLVIFVAGIVLLVVIALAVQHLTGNGFANKSNNQAYSDNKREPYSNSANCKSGPVAKFDTEFTDLSKISAINPIGGIGGGSPGRSYIGVASEAKETPLYSPTDMILETIVYARRGGLTTPGEYGLYFRLSCDVTLLFDHIDKVSDKIRALSPKEPENTSRTDKGTSPHVLIKKGELLGYSNGTPLARTFDFLITDRSKPAIHINPKRWEWEQAIFAQCPYDYFSDELKKKYYAKIGEIAELSGKEMFIPAENCGLLSHDIAGTASGGWFRGDSTDIRGDYLAIARQGKNVFLAQRKDGLFNSDSHTRDYSPSVFPEHITVGQEACYFDQNANKWAYIKLVSDTKLLVAKGSGSCPSSVPTTTETWER